MVYDLCRWRNDEAGIEIIPESVLTKPPSAELRPGQLDTDSLPPYEVLDPVLRCLVEQNLSVIETSERTGMARAGVAALHAKVQGAEFKRYQYPPTVRVSERCWSGRRMPVAHRFREH